jgi:hypothetical protein
MWISQAWQRVSENGSMWVCGNWRGFPTFQIALDTTGAPLSSVVIWDEEWIGVGPLNGLRQRYELIFHSAKGTGMPPRTAPGNSRNWLRALQAHKHSLRREMRCLVIC